MHKLQLGIIAFEFICKEKKSRKFFLLCFLVTAQNAESNMRSKTFSCSPGERKDIVTLIHPCLSHFNCLIVEKFISTIIKNPHILLMTLVTTDTSTK